MSQTQKQLILDYLRTHPDGITPKEAEDRFGCMRLASRMSDLKREGIRFDTHRVKFMNRYGKPGSYARYVLRED